MGQAGKGAEEVHRAAAHLNGQQINVEDARDPAGFGPEDNAKIGAEASCEKGVEGELEAVGTDEKQEYKPTFPDGGSEAWSVVFGVWAITFLSWGNLTSFGQFQAYLTMQRLPNESNSSVAWVGALQIFFLYLAGVVAGKLFDRGFCRHLIFGGSLLYLVAVWLLEVCSRLWHYIIVQGCMLGIAFGLLFIPGVSAVGHYFARRRATALGVAATGSSIGAIILPIQLHKMFPDSYANATRAFAAILTVLLICANLFVKTRLPPRQGGAIFDMRVFKDPSYTLFVLGCCITTTGFYIPMFLGPTYSLERGMDPELTYYVVAILASGSVFGRTMPNIMADHLGVINILFATVLLSGVLQFIWLACTSTAALIVFFVLYGFSTGAFVAGLPAGVATLTPDMRDYGLRNGMLCLLVAPFGLAGPPAAGALFDISATAAACFGGACVLCGAVLIGMVWLRETRRRGTLIV